MEENKEKTVDDLLDDIKSMWSAYDNRHGDPIAILHGKITDSEDDKLYRELIKLNIMAHIANGLEEMNYWLSLLNNRRD